MPTAVDDFSGPRGYIFTGNSQQGGTYTTPYSGYGPAPQAMPQASWNWTNPTYQATQLTNAFTQNMQRYGGQMTAQGAMGYWGQMQPLYQQAYANPMALPQLLGQANQYAQQAPMYAPRPSQTSGAPRPSGQPAAPPPYQLGGASNQPRTQVYDDPSKAYPAVLPDYGKQSITPPHTGGDPQAMGPDGRTFAEITGTPYRSPGERDFYLGQIGKAVDPSTGNPVDRPSPSPQPTPQIKPPSGMGGAGPNGRTLQEVAGTPYRSAEERDWYLAQQGRSGQSQGVPSGLPSSATPPSSQQTQQLQQYATTAAQSNGLDPTIFRNLITHESGWKVDAYNAASGASGLGQFLPSTAQAYGATPEQLRANPQLALNLSAQMLGSLNRQYGGDQQKAYAAYFIGPGNVNNAVTRGGANWLAQADTIAQGYGQGSVTQYLQSIGALGPTRR